MFQRLFELGSTIARRDSLHEVHDLLKDPIADDYKNIVEIEFGNDGAFVAVHSRQISTTEKNKVLYKKGAPNGFDSTAVSKFAEVPSKTVNRVRKAVAAIAKAVTEESNSALHEQLSAVSNSFESHQDEIAEQVAQAVKDLELNVENRGLLSASITRRKKLVPLWSLDETAELVIDSSMSGYGTNDKAGDCIEKDAVCSVCIRERPVVFGNFSKLKTYNLDKPGMIAGGFANSQTARNFPVCPECAAKLALGINKATTLLAYKMAGQSYLVLPQCHNDELRDRFVELAEQRRNGESLHEEHLGQLTDDENEILDLVAEKFGDQDQVSMKFVFFDSEQQSWKIRGEVDQVLPSRIREVFDAKKLVERRGWRGEKDFISMGLIREFAGGSFANSRREFLGHIDAVLSGKSLSPEGVLRNLVDQILIAMKRDEKKAIYVVRRAFLLFDFYQQLAVIPLTEGKPMSSTLTEKSSYGKYLHANPQFFGGDHSSEKCVAFLTGALVRCVMNAQYEKLKSTPFSKKLRGMRITPEMLRKLVAESKEKLRAYEADQYPSNRNLLELICDQWVACGNEFSLSADETTFLFTVGMTLNYHIIQEFGKEDN